jgi:hypothetical protein
MSAAPLAGQMTMDLCKSTDTVILAAGGQQLVDACRAASGAGVRDALRFAALIYGLAGIAYLFLSRILQKDFLAKLH